MLCPRAQREAIHRSGLSCSSMYKNKARIKSGPFIHKAGVFLFFYFLHPPRECLALSWSHFRSAIALSPLAGLTIPHTVPCLAEKSVGKFLPLKGMMVVSYSSAVHKQNITFVGLQNGVWIKICLRSYLQAIVYRVNSTSCLTKSK